MESYGGYRRNQRQRPTPTRSRDRRETSKDNYDKNYYDKEKSDGSDEDKKPVCEECVGTHLQKIPCEGDESGENRMRRNYEWLEVLGYGKVVNVYFKEASINNGQWTWYDDHWWEVHCKAISHGDDLYEDHVRAFVNPETRIIELLFHFEDGIARPPTELFYKLEKEYFDERRYCKQ